MDVMPKRIGKSSSQITIRLDDEVIGKLDAVAAHFTAKLGTAFVRADALRMVVTRGLEVVETEIGASKPAKRK